MRSKSIKRFLAAAMTALMCVGLLAGCGNGDKASSGGEESQGSVAAENQGNSGAENSGQRDKLELTITMEGTAGFHDGPITDAFEELMSQKLNREVELHYNMIASGEYGDKAQLMFATGDLGDIVQIPFLFDYSQAASEGMLLDVSKYQEQFPNLWYYLDQTSAGIASVTRADGAIYSIPAIELPRFPKDHGMLPNNLSMYRYDVFEELGIKIPETLDEVYEAAKKIKEAYPDIYPINTRWNDLRSLFMANHTSNDVYWNGEEYVFGMFDEGYKDAIEFAHKLYAEGLLDPEYISDDDDMLKSKALNDQNMIMLCDWFTTPGEFTRLSSTGQIFCVTLFPNNPKYGDAAWQNVQRVNEISVNVFTSFAINSQVKDPEGTVEFMNHCYDEDVVRLLTWGIEGESYTLDENGNPKFVDAILDAEDPWLAADEYNIRASRNMRPGLQLSADTSAFAALAADDWLYYDGALHQEPIEQSEYYLSFPYPDNPYIPPSFSEPVLTFTEEENSENSRIATIYTTIRAEQEAAFVSGTRSMDEWDDFINEIKSAADIDALLTNYNNAAQRYFDVDNQN